MKVHTVVQTRSSNKEICIISLLAKHTDSKIKSGLHNVIYVFVPVKLLI